MDGPRLPARYTLTLSLLAFRQRFDDLYGTGKDGAGKWAEYQARVRYRIVPGLLLRKLLGNKVPRSKGALVHRHRCVACNDVMASGRKFDTQVITDHSLSAPHLGFRAERQGHALPADACHTRPELRSRRAGAVVADPGAHHYGLKDHGHDYGHIPNRFSFGGSPCQVKPEQEGRLGRSRPPNSRRPASG